MPEVTLIPLRIIGSREWDSQKNQGPCSQRAVVEGLPGPPLLVRFQLLAPCFRRNHDGKGRHERHETILEHEHTDILPSLTTDCRGPSTFFRLQLGTLHGHTALHLSIPADPEDFPPGSVAISHAESATLQHGRGRALGPKEPCLQLKRQPSRSNRRRGARRRQTSSRGRSRGTGLTRTPSYVSRCLLCILLR